MIFVNGLLQTLSRTADTSDFYLNESGEIVTNHELMVGDVLKVIFLSAILAEIGT